EGCCEQQPELLRGSHDCPSLPIVPVRGRPRYLRLPRRFVGTPIPYTTRRSLVPRSTALSQTADIGGGLPTSAGEVSDAAGRNRQGAVRADGRQDAAARVEGVDGAASAGVGDRPHRADDAGGLRG